MVDDIGGRLPHWCRALPLLGALVVGTCPAGPAAAAIIEVPAHQTTVRNAVNAAAHGDTILVSPGTHNGGAFIANKSLTIASRYLVTGDTALVSQTVISGVVGSVCGGASGCQGNAVLEFGTNAHNSSVVGLTVRGGENGIVAYSIVNVSRCRIVANGDGVDYFPGAGGILENSVFEDNTDDGIDLNGRMNITIRNNIIRNNRDDGIEFRLYGFVGPAVTVDIIGNRITGNGEDGIQLIDYPEVSGYVMRIERNFFAANFDATGNSAAIGIMPNGETVESLVGAPMPERLYVINNTFMGEKNGIVGGANVIALNNVFTGIQTRAVRRVGGSSIVSYSMFWNNGINHDESVLDPPHLLYVDPALGPTGIPAAGSPAIDAGTAFFQWGGETVLNLPPYTYTGSAPEMGAIEFGSGPSPTNTPPSVNAGPDQTVSLSAGADLDGTAYDDGLPYPPGLVTTHWSVVSGAGPMAFQDPAELRTRAMFSQPGVYLLQLIAYDGAATTADTVKVTVVPGANLPPVVDAGPNRTITLPNPAWLDGTVSDDGEPNPPGSLTTTWSVGSGPGGVVFGNPNAVDTQASFTVAGTYILRLTANDGAISVTDSMQVTALPPPPPIERRIATGSDDAEEAANGVPNLSSSDIELVFDTSLQTVGLRFTNLTVPPGATIANAYIQFEADEVQSEVTNLTIRGQAADNPGTFTTASLNISSRPRTAAAVSWSPPPWTVIGEAGPNQRTPDLKTVLQEIVSRPGWASGNAVAIIITGTGHRTARSFEGLPSGAALLRVELGSGPPPNTAPVVDAGPDRNIVLPNDAVLDGTVSDDGLPDPPGAVSLLWTVVSGPGPVYFGDPTIEDPPVTFSVAGTYVLRLTANDGALVASDSMQFTVQPVPNAAPYVDAGPDRNITLPASAFLDGTVNDDGLPNPPGAVTTTWRRVSGPGAVTFADSNAVDTQASFTVAGTYVLRLTANDGALVASDSMQVTVLPAPNAPPFVDAGPDRNVTLPASAFLDGTVSDDGLPNPPGAVTTTWRRVSGPGAVTFADSNAVDTQASFTVAGTYVLRLTASDGALVASDSMQVTVLPDPNTAPVVDAGPDQTIMLPASAALDGTVSDDGLPAPPVLTATWSRVSGPGAVTFADSNAVDTQASFTVAGVYVLRLSVSDGRLSGSDLVQITVLAPAPPLERRIAASSDDAEESASGVMNLTSTNLDLVYNASDQTVGLRFTGLTLPAGATITSAWIQFTSRRVDQQATTLAIRGQAADNPGTFTSASGNLSDRPRTTASVGWSPPPWTGIGDAGAAQRTPELKTVLQEVVSRPGWASGNALVIVITGSGVRVASTWDGNAAQAALLHVEYASAEPMAISREPEPIDGAAGAGPGIESSAADGAGEDAPLGGPETVAPDAGAAGAVTTPAAPEAPERRFDFGLHGVSPNPSRGELQVEFGLAGPGAATLELVDIAGRRVAVRDVGGAGPGRHRLVLRQSLPAGVYIVRLTQGARTVRRKAAVMR